MTEQHFRFEKREADPKDSSAERKKLLSDVLNVLPTHGDLEDWRDRTMTELDSALQRRRFFGLAGNDTDQNEFLNDIARRRNLRIDEEAFAIHHDSEEQYSIYSTPSEYGKAINQGARIKRAVDNILSKHEAATYITMDANGTLLSPDKSTVGQMVNRVVGYLTQRHPELLKQSYMETSKSVTLPEWSEHTLTPEYFNGLNHNDRRLILSTLLKAFYRPGLYPLADLPVSEREARELEELYKSGVNK